MDEELKKEEKVKVQQRGLEEAKGEENSTKILPTRESGERRGRRNKKNTEMHK